MLYTIDTIKNKSKEIVNAAMVDYKFMLEKDKNEKTSSLKPGETLGFANYNGFYSSVNRDNCANVLNGYASQINELLNDVNQEYNKKISEPPTTEQTNLLTVLAIGKPSKEELQSVLNANKGNYATYSAINRIANENDLHLDAVNPLQDLENVKNSLSEDLNSLSIHSAANRLNPSYQAFAELMNGF